MVDEQSHFNTNVKVGNANHPELLFFEKNDQVIMSSATIDTAYKGVELKRTMALIKLPLKHKSGLEQSLVVDVFDIKSKELHQYDLPVHYKGHLISTDFALDTQLTSLPVLGEENGYQHLWLKAQAQPKAGLSQITWLNDNGRFYTSSAVMDGDSTIMFTQIGANDPLFNLRNENAFINRKTNAKNHTFVSVLEPHGEYNPSKEFTISAVSSIEKLTHKKVDNIDVIEISLVGNQHYVLAFNSAKSIKAKELNSFAHNGKNYQFNGRFKLFTLTSK